MTIFKEAAVNIKEAAVNIKEAAVNIKGAATILTSTLIRSLVAWASLYLALARLCRLFSSRESFRDSPATPLKC